MEDCQTLNKPKKRKISEGSCKDSLLTKSKKTRRHVVLDEEQSLNSKHNGETAQEASACSPDLPQGSQQTAVRTADFLEQKGILEAAVNDTAAKQEFPTVDTSETGGTCPPKEGCTSELEMSRGSISVGPTSHVQWKNAYALCWLDCILSVLVHLEGLANTVTESEEDSVFWRLFTKYNQANELLHINQVNGVKGDYYKKLTPEIIATIDTALNEVRDEIFHRLQPQLRCTLGDMESPVFAFPLLLKTEPHIEKFFMYSYSWNFKCSQCGHEYQNRCMKSLATFTNVIPEWHPLNAAHFGPCNSCKNKQQIRKMVLEKVSPIFMLHFVNGLPHNDLQRYSFHFGDCLYQVTSVIQYQANNHFITWVLDTDGCWLECDDLKGPCSERYEKFEVPAAELHIVIWEKKISQIIDKTTADLPLKKTDDQHAFDNEKPVSSPSCPVDDASAEKLSEPHPTNVSVDHPNTLSQDEAIASGDQILSCPESLVDEISLLTFEDIHVNSEDLPLENSPVTENVVVQTSTLLQSQESQVISSVSPPCNLKSTQDQFVDLIFPSQVANLNMNHVQPNAEGTVFSQSVNNSLAAVPLQGVNLMEVEGAIELDKNAPLKQLLFPKTEQLKPEQPVTSPLLNMKKKETATSAQTTATKSLQNPSIKENQKKPFVGSWVKGLLSRGASFMPPCVSAHNRNIATDLQSSVKTANNFGGFKTKSVGQKTKKSSKKAQKCASKSPVSDSLPANMTPHPHTTDSVDLETLKKCENVPQVTHSSRENENGFLVSSGDCRESQIHKLRLKLLKKLRAKKKKLAALTSSPPNGTFPSENLESVSHCGSPNDCESLEDLLKELQYQIAVSGTKSGSTTVPGVSPDSSETHEQILAELLSPTTVVSADFSENGETDVRYLEMGDNYVSAPVPSKVHDVPQSTYLPQDHNYCSPTKKNQCELQPDSLASNASVRTLNLESSVKIDIFDEFFSTSLNSLADDALDLPHFDECLFDS